MFTYYFYVMSTPGLQYFSAWDLNPDTVHKNCNLQTFKKCLEIKFHNMNFDQFDISK